MKNGGLTIEATSAAVPTVLTLQIIVKRDNLIVRLSSFPGWLFINNHIKVKVKEPLCSLYTKTEIWCLMIGQKWTATADGVWPEVNSHQFLFSIKICDKVTKSLLCIIFLFHLCSKYTAVPGFWAAFLYTSNKYVFTVKKEKYTLLKVLHVSVQTFTQWDSI